MTTPEPEMRLVPVEPTEAMVEEADRARALPEIYIREIWAAMLAAAPAQSNPVAGSDGRNPVVNAPASPPETGWRTMETAPKDGSDVLAICATAYSPVAGVTWWCEGWTHYSRPADKWHGGVGRWFPTHWMPLPTPPASGREGEVGR